MSGPSVPRIRPGWAAASAAAALGWPFLLSAAPAGFYAVASAYCALWLALSARAAGLRPRAGAPLADVGAGLAAALLLYGAARAFLWTFCGPISQSLCAPLTDVLARLGPRGTPATLALILVVAPAEEVFWRGLVQGRLLSRLGPARAVAATAALSALVQLAAGQPFLALAAFPTSVAWGALAAWRGRLRAALVSHSAWDLLVAVLLRPVG